MITLAYVALWTFVFTIPWEGFIRINGISVASRAAGALAFGLAIVAVATSGRLRRLHAFHFAALLFVVWAGIGLLVFSTTPRLPNKFWTFVQLFLVVWMIWELAPSTGRVLRLLTAYVFGSYVGALSTILLYRREAGALRRFAAAGVDPNDLAMTLALALPMAWYLGMTTRRPVLRWIFRAYVPIGLFAIGLTGSRGGMIATVVALLIVPLGMTRLTPGRLAVAILLLGLSGALAVTYLPRTVVERLGTARSEVEEGGIGGRLKLWKAGLRAFTNKPIAGYGPGGFIPAIQSQLGLSSQVAHNSYISVLVEEGIVGLALYLAMFLGVAGSALRLPPEERRFALVLLATVATAMLPLTWEDRKSVWIILATLFGLARARIGETEGGAGRRGWMPAPVPAGAGPPLRVPLPAGARGADRGKP
jgi:O-antigen ligase